MKPVNNINECMLWEIPGDQRRFMGIVHERDITPTKTLSAGIVILPPGISFYTFQEVAYVVDVYQGKLPPSRSFVDYGLFITLFPHLIAGPIQRPSHLLPQVQRPRTFQERAFFDGCMLIVSGLFRKTVIADNCANLANLMLVRGSGRVKEIAVRLAMGATRPRIIGQLLIESLSLSALGGITGLAVAFWADRALMKIYLPSDSGGMNISSAPDLRILLFNLAVTVLTGVIFGLVPALQTTKPNLAGTLKDQAGAVVGGSGHHRLRKGLVVAQVTLSLLLLVGAGLFVRSLANLRDLGPGFSPERLVGFNIDPSLNGYTPERMKVFYPQLSEALGSIPGVQSATLSQAVLVANGTSTTSFRTPGRDSRPGDARKASITWRRARSS